MSFVRVKEENIVSAVEKIAFFSLNLLKISSQTQKSSRISIDFLLLFILILSVLRNSICLFEKFSLKMLF